MAWFKGDPDPAYDVARENAEEWAEAQKEQDQNNVLNSYPAYVSNIAKRAHGHTTAEIIIDVDGRSFVLEWRTSLI